MTDKPDETRALPPRPDDGGQPLTGQRVGRYEVGERLGRGGMGEVYHAFDPLLKRRVALKRVVGDTVGDAERRARLLHEARALSSLSHPAIASVFDVVESAGQLFIVEEFVTGTSLRDRLREPIDVEQFLPVAKACLSALDEAARRGIVHCDIKPENIVLTDDGRPKILDFGLARRAPTGSGEDTLATRVHLPSIELRGGTPSYMAPESFVESVADPRSDLWAMGVVFYEMLTGAHPFRRDTSAETARCILTEHPEEPSHLRPGLPPTVDSVVMSMLVKEPEQRASSASEVLSALRGESPPRPSTLPARRPRRLVPIAAAAGVIALSLAAWSLWPRRPTAPAAGPPVYLAVEPFATPGAEGDVHDFALGFVGAAAVRLGEIDRLHAVPSDIYFQVDDRWHGDIQLVVDRLRVTYEVTGTDGSVTRGVLHGGTDEIFDLRDQLAHDVSRILAERHGLTPLPRGSETPPETTPAAYLFYLRGAGHLSSSERSGADHGAARYFEEALEQDPDFVAARVGLAEALWRDAQGDTALAERAREAALEAVKAAPDRADAHRVRGRILLESGEIEEAKAELEQAFELDPTHADGSQLLADALRRLGREDDAVATLRRAAEIRPDDWSLQRNLGRQLFQLGRLEEALDVCRRMVALTPQNARGKSTLGAIHYYLGQNSEAIDAYLESIAIQPNFRAFSNIATIYMAEERYPEAATNLEAALELDDTDYRVWANLVTAYDNLPGKDAELTAANARVIELITEGLAQDPADAIARSLLALSYAVAEREEDARNAAEEALALAPDDMDVLFHSAGAHERLGDRVRALELAQRALEAGFPLGMMEAEASWRDLVASPEFREMIARLPGAARTGA